MTTMKQATAPATPEETRAFMTRLSARGYVQLRQILVQLPDASKPRTSVLGRAVSARRHRALLLYILLLTCWPWLEKKREPLPASVWLRALTPPAGGGLTWSASTLSRAWQDLEEMGLLEPRERVGRSTMVRPRREDGESHYEVPGGRRDRWNTYFVLPDSFWNQGIFARLSLPGLAMLLIIAKETNSKKEMYLPYSKAKDWYGISSKTAQNGVAELMREGLVYKREQIITAPLSATGFTTRTWYSLTGDFGHDARASMRRKASKERSARVAAPSPTPSPKAVKRAARGRS